MIDCDVHCAPAGWPALEPYVSAAWWQFVQEHQHGNDGPSGVAIAGLPYAYPPATARQDALEAGGGPNPPTTYEALKAQVLDGSDADGFILNCVALFDANRNPYFQAGLSAAINDWLRAEWLDRDDRLRASLVVPWLDTDAAIAEIERVGDDPRFVQVLLPVRAEAPWGQKAFHGIFAAAAERGLAVGLHAWGPPNHADNTKGFTTFYVEDYLSNATIAQQHIISLVAEGVFAQYPDLRVAVLECGFTWLPSLMWRMDKDWKGLWPEIPWVKEKPSAYVRRAVAVTTAPAHLGAASDEQIREIVDLGGPDRLLYASDYPHEHGASGERLLAALDDETRAAVLGGNAEAFYALGRPAAAGR